MGQNVNQSLQIGVFYQHNTSRDTAILITEFLPDNRAFVKFWNVSQYPYLYIGGDEIQLQHPGEYRIVGGVNVKSHS